MANFEVQTTNPEFVMCVEHHSIFHLSLKLNKSKILTTYQLHQFRSPIHLQFLMLEFD